jgi:hypothetical protein
MSANALFQIPIKIKKNEKTKNSIRVGEITGRDSARDRPAVLADYTQLQITLY